MRHQRRGMAVTAFLAAATLAGCGLVGGAPGSGAGPTAQPGPTAEAGATAPSGDPTDPAATPSTASPSPTAPASPTTSPAPSPSPSPTPPPGAVTRAPQAELTFVPGADAVELALAAARVYWVSAPLVVVGRTGDAAALDAAAQAGVPLLLTGEPVAADDATDGEGTPDDGDPAAPAPIEDAVLDALHGELARLGTRAVLSFDPAFEAPDGVDVLGDGDPVPEGGPTEPLPGAALVTDTSARSRAAAQTARSAGVEVFTARRGDPRAARDLITAYAEGAQLTSVTALGDAFGDAALLSARMRAVRTGVTLPGGSQLVFDDTRYVALYGSPLTPALGVLGEQNVKKSVTRARKVAKPYTKLVDEQVVPMFEIIATVASAGKGADGNYSNELDPESIRPYVEAARKAGVYVLLDLQPGRTDFLTQAKLYEEFLLEPHVGLALDPEWRLKKNQVHLRQIGSVGIKEVNRVVHYLADLVEANDLPQKMLVLHQFTTSMIRNRDKLDTSRSELAVVVHVDGQGALGSKYGTWANIRKGAPKGLYWGWKNFYDEDQPMATPKQTVAVDPTPDLVTYQ